MATIGPHLLGRIPSPPDPRDFTPRMLRRLAAAPDLSMTLAEFLDSQWTMNWAGILAFWRWVKQQRKPGSVPVYPGWILQQEPLDQGDFGTCVGNGWEHWEALTPVEGIVTEADARQVYYEATIIDGHPDDPDAEGGGQQGATVRAGAKAMQARGRLAAYAFATDLADVDDFLRKQGPVVVGTNWTERMFEPNDDGVIDIGGAVMGGHCWNIIDSPELVGEDSLYECLNSWGPGWGRNGRFFVRRRDLRELLNDGGEACLALELPR